MGEATGRAQWPCRRIPGLSTTQCPRPGVVRLRCGKPVSRGPRSAAQTRPSCSPRRSAHSSPAAWVVSPPPATSVRYDPPNVNAPRCLFIPLAHVFRGDAAQAHGLPARVSPIHDPTAATVRQFEVLTYRDSWSPVSTCGIIAMRSAAWIASSPDQRLDTRHQLSPSRSVSTAPWTWWQATEDTDSGRNGLLRPLPACTPDA
jgi:hypothetical protein